MGGDPLHIHLGPSQIHGALAPGTSLPCARIEAAFAHLRHGEPNFADTGEHGFILKPVAVRSAAHTTLVRADANELFAFDQTGLIDKLAKRFACAVEALFKQARIGRREPMSWIVGVE